MAIEKYILPYFVIVLSLISSCCASNLNNDHLLNGFQLESGYGFQAYSSYFGHVRGVNFDNNSGKNFKKFGRSLAASVETFNVLNFGAKGDGSTDDTKVNFSDTSI